MEYVDWSRDDTLLAAVNITILNTESYHTKYGTEYANLLEINEIYHKSLNHNLCHF